MVCSLVIPVCRIRESYLQVDHLPRLRRLGALPRDLQHGDSVAADLLLEVAQLALHLVAPTDLIDELALERVHVGVELLNKQML